MHKNGLSTKASKNIKNELLLIKEVLIESNEGLKQYVFIKNKMIVEKIIKILFRSFQEKMFVKAKRLVRANASVKNPK